MSGMNSDQLHRSTLGIYSSLMDDFNPSLQRLVSLGNSYAQAFQVLAATSDAYFTALSKIGDQAFHTISSRSIGDVLIQISESQRRLTLEMERVFRWFNTDVIVEMENNIRLDKDYISGSRRRYEVEVHNQASVLDRQLRRGPHQDVSDCVQFLRESHREALEEEERRYRFLAEKHCSFMQSIVHLMSKSGVILQHQADTWKEEVNATRGPQARTPSTGLDNMEENWRSREEQSLGNIPSRAPSPQASLSRAGSESLGGGGGGFRPMRAIVAHQPSASNPTLLPFPRGEMISVMVQQPRNGWLYGRADSSAHVGWFPAAFVEDPTKANTSSNSTLQSSRGSSSSNHGGGGPAPPPPPPPPPSSSSHKLSEMQPSANRKEASSSNKERAQQHKPGPELFPRGTNPFATVKLKPTSTNDRSAPHLRR
ncbi:BAR/IMD domain-containing adapter protein 2-like 2 [Genypterus blacodes]|uniref:BAR/IMD domain-containing adapter protein 2-like 2 n=1 Tax=Genypterus blacodes TaxID=154954 RepID=UPI003F7598E0